MKVLCNVADMVEMELEEFTRKERLTMTDVEAVYKLVDILKDVETIMAMKEYDDDYSMRGSYGRMDRGRGYSRERYARDRYSRDGSKEKMLESLEDVLGEANTESERQAIRHLMEKLTRS